MISQKAVRRSLEITFAGFHRRVRHRYTLTLTLTCNLKSHTKAAQRNEIGEDHSGEVLASTPHEAASLNFLPYPAGPAFEPRPREVSNS